MTRRVALGMLWAAAGLGATAPGGAGRGGASAAEVDAAAAAAEASAGASIDFLETQAFKAYADMDFQLTVQLLDKIVQRAPPSEFKWVEFRAAVRTDMKDFRGSLEDYDAALRTARGLGEGAALDVPRLLAGRALTREGLSDWAGALADYEGATAEAARVGLEDDPYLLNSMGNVKASLAEWEDARAYYLAAFGVFQGARGFYDVSTGTTSFARQDGAVFAASNAALMLAQLGDLEGALGEADRIVRKAPGSVDMRAAVAALRWARGDAPLAEASWEFACDRIAVGCDKYRDLEWLRVVRRWPPRMVGLMADFLALRGG